jgi:hypothetical protein
MENLSKSNGRWRWVLGMLVMGAAFMLYACDQPAGQSGLANKPPPNVGAIANVDGSDDTKKDENKAQPGAEQKPAESSAGSQPAQTAPKQ